MIDIETMSTHISDAVVLSIGGVLFEMSDAGPTIIDTRAWHPDVAWQIVHGRRVDRTTQDWWASQSKEALASLLGVQKPVSEILVELGGLIAQSEVVWANGIVFDLGNVQRLYEQCEMVVPWAYNAARDARTIYKLFPSVRKKAEKPKAIPHDCVSDCIQQVWGLWEAQVGA